MPIKILKRPYNTPSSVVQNNSIYNNPKKVIVETPSMKIDSPRTMSSVLIAKYDGTILKLKQFLKPYVPSKATSKEQVAKNIVIQKSLRDSKQKFEWKVKSDENKSVTFMNTMIPTTSRKINGLSTLVSKLPLVEYDF